VSSEYPFSPDQAGARNYGVREATHIFIRDGFIDRYTGQRLVFPPVLRVISMALPVEFPFHENWKMDCTHQAYYALTATVDHLVPVCRGGSDDESNLVTTCMARNSGKLNYTLEELGWSLHPPGDMREWDGFVNWVLDYTDTYAEPLRNGSIRSWCGAARTELNR